ncbi:hypothetical protein EDC96DRAFT_569147 [Choanephora cucurbitarum]|nr:hypothetical protein EDC96DRAFT_569147 [Choanephora cucurbitarum]
MAYFDDCVSDMHRVQLVADLNCNKMQVVTVVDSHSDAILISTVSIVTLLSILPHQSAMSFSSGFELIIRLYLYNLHKSSRVTDFRMSMTDHYLALLGVIYIYQSLGYTKHFIAAYNIKLGT